MGIHQNTVYKAILNFLSLMSWASGEQVATWVRGNPGRDKQAEYYLPYFVRNYQARRVKVGKKFAYTLVKQGRIPHDDEFEIQHALGCTECFLRLYFSDTNCEVIPEKWFFGKGFGVVPEWGLYYPSGQVILFEFCTKDNVRRLNVLESKITRYSKMAKENHRILFVMDVFSDKVLETVNKLKPQVIQSPQGYFLFTDYTTFLNVEFGKQLSSKIYLWPDDGEKHSLGEDHVSRPSFPS